MEYPALEREYCLLVDPSAAEKVPALVAGKRVKSQLNWRHGQDRRGKNDQQGSSREVSL
jgi:hypothetical protein